MSNKLELMSKEVVLPKSEVLSWNLLGRAKGSYENLQLGQLVTLLEIQTFTSQIGSKSGTLQIKGSVIHVEKSVYPCNTAHSSVLGVCINHLLYS